MLQYFQPSLPPGIAVGNGRLEADEIDISTKFAGRIAEMLVDEGDMVEKAAQVVVARMDTSDLEVLLKKAEAQALGARRGLDETRANVAQQQSQLTLAQQEFDRTQTLVKRGVATQQLLDQRRQQLDAAMAELNVANFRVAQTERALDAATQDVALQRNEPHLTGNLDWNTASLLLDFPNDSPINHSELLPGARNYLLLQPAMDGRENFRVSSSCWAVLRLRGFHDRVLHRAIRASICPPAIRRLTLSPNLGRRPHLGSRHVRP